MKGKRKKLHLLTFYQINYKVDIGMKQKHCLKVLVLDI